MLTAIISDIPQFLIVADVSQIEKRLKPFPEEYGAGYRHITYIYGFKNPTWAPGCAVYKLDRRTVPKHLRDLVYGIYRMEITYDA